MVFVRDISGIAKLYIFSTIAIGGMVLSYSVYQSLMGPDLRWLYLASMTLLGSFFSVRIPSFKGKVQSLIVSISDIFIFTAILLFNPQVAVTVASIDSVLSATISLTSQRLYKVLFNLAQLSIVTFVVGHAFYKLQGSSPPLDPRVVKLSDQFVKLAFCSFMYFGLKTLAVATPI